MKTTFIILVIVAILLVGVIDYFPKLKARLLGWRLGTIDDARQAYGEGNFEHKYLGSFFREGFVSVYRKKKS
ncbi:MAG: hypothetical protein ACK4TA_12700 [Saprospiraceae bacterium]